MLDEHQNRRCRSIRARSATLARRARVSTHSPAAELNTTRLYLTRRFEKSTTSMPIASNACFHVDPHNVSRLTIPKSVRTDDVVAAFIGDASHSSILLMRDTYYEPTRQTQICPSRVTNPMRSAIAPRPSQYRERENNPADRPAWSETVPGRCTGARHLEPWGDGPPHQRVVA